MARHHTGIEWYRCVKQKPEIRNSYRILAPVGRYLPTDESIKTLLSRHRSLGLKFKACVREADGRGVLYVYPPKPNPLAYRASAAHRRKLDAFIRALARACPQERPSYIFERLKQLST